MPGLSVVSARQRRDQDPAVLGLPPRVDDRAALAADVLPVPDPGLRVDRLADGPEQLQRRQVVPLRVLGPGLDERADQGRRRVVLVDPVALDDLPVAVDRRVRRVALVEDAGRAVVERAVDDVAVAGDPADVGGAPPHVVVVHVEDPLVRARHVREVAAGGVLHRLRLRGRARGVQQEQDVLRGAGLGLALGRLVGDQLVPPVIAARLERDIVARSGAGPRPARRSGRARSSASAVRLSGILPPLRQPSSWVISTEAPGARQSLSERLRGEAAEDDDVRGADSGAGEHRDRQLRDHAHVDPDPVALLDAEPRSAFAKRQTSSFSSANVIARGGFVDRLGHEVVGDLAPRAPLDVPVEAVVGDVQPPSANHVQCGGSHSSDLVGSSNQLDDLPSACSSQKPSKSSLGVLVAASRP